MMNTVYKCERCGRKSPCVLMSFNEEYDLDLGRCPYDCEMLAHWDQTEGRESDGYDAYCCVYMLKFDANMTFDELLKARRDCFKMIDKLFEKLGGRNER